jgi:hypothetical protein
MSVFGLGCGGTPSSVSDLLRTYLQDHHAGATVGVELARRAAGSNQDTEYGEPLARLADEIAEDRETLERVMERLGVKPDRIKDAGGWAAEKLGRLKPNNRLLGYSPLSRVVELEGLVIGVTGKLALWEALRDSIGDSIDGVDFVALGTRAQGQRTDLEHLRRKAAADAFERD